MESLARQSRRPDRVVVVADNCADATVAVAEAHGVEVVETAGNTEKKAGALNQQLARLLPHTAHRDVLLVMDADSTLSPDFLEVALGLLEDDPDLVAVGGLFYGEDGGRLVGQFQRNEYTRYQRLVARKLRPRVRPHRDGLRDPGVRAAGRRGGARAVAAGTCREVSTTPWR